MKSRLPIRSLFLQAWPALAILAILALRLALTWGVWPDPLIDFGREVYLPWRIAGGGVLYRDVCSYYGPLSPNFNALVFSLAGPGIWNLLAVNMVIAAAIAILLYSLLRRTGHWYGALAAGAVFAWLFACGARPGETPFNYIAPYSHDLIHGLLLSLIALMCALRYAARGSFRLAATCGVLLGLIFLTKPENFVATGMALAVGSAAIAWREPHRRRDLLRHLGIACSAAICPIFAAWALLCLAMPPAQAWTGVLGSWPFLSGPVTKIPFFDMVRGTDYPARNLFLIGVISLSAAGLVALFLAGGSAAARRLRPALAAIVMAAISTAAMAALWPLLRQCDLFRPLLFYILIIAAVLLFGLRTADPAVRRTGIERLILAGFAAGMLIKSPFHPQITHYGFVLAMPAAMLVIAAAVDWLPEFLAARTARSVWPLRAAMLPLVLIGALSQVGPTRQGFKFVEMGPDSLYINTQGVPLVNAAAELAQRAAPGDTVTVLPEGIMVNYLTRMRTPTYFVDFHPPTFLMYGSDRVTKNVEQGRPTYIILVHRVTTEHGASLFGRDYAQDLYAWVQQEYTPIITLGNTPLQSIDQKPGVQILERNDHLAARTQLHR